MTKYNIEINLAVNKAVVSSNKLKTSLSTVEDELKKITNATSSMATIMLSSMQKPTREVNKLKQALKETQKEMSKLKGYASKLGTVLGVASLGAGLVALQRYSDGYTDMQNKIKSLSAEGSAYGAIQEELFNIAQRSRVGLSDTVQLYGRLSLAQKNLNTTQTEMLRFTEAIGKALVVSGASANTMRGVLLQLSQAMGTDIVRAEEFNSILEGGIRIAQAAADGIEGYEGNIAKLRRAVIDGEIASRQLYEGVMSQIPKIEAEFAKTSATISQAFTKINNAMTLFVGKMNEATGVGSAFTFMLDEIARNLGAVITAIGVGAGVSSFFALGSGLTGVGKEALKASKGLKGFWKALAPLVGFAKHPIVAGILALGAAFFYFRDSTDEVTLSLKDQEREWEIVKAQLYSYNILTEQTAKKLQNQTLALYENAKARALLARESVGALALERSNLIDKALSNPNMSAIEAVKLKKQIELVEEQLIKAQGEWQRLRDISMEIYKGVGESEIKVGEGIKYDRTIELKRLKDLRDGILKSLDQEYEKKKTIGVQQKVLAELQKAEYDVTADSVTKTGHLKGEWDGVAIAIAEAVRKNEELVDKTKDIPKESPFENWITDAQNLSDNLQNSLISALGATEDAIIDFVKTGEFSFSEFASSVIEDLARVMIRMQMANMMASMFGMNTVGFGSALGFANGGFVSGPGTGTSDSIPAMLSNGEYVVNARATSQFGPLLEAINRGPRFANGGLVGGGSISGNGFGGGDTQIQVIDQRGSNAPPIQTKTETNSDGSKMIKMLIQSEVSKGITNGSYDTVMGSSYGLRRSSTKR